MSIVGLDMSLTGTGVTVLNGDDYNMMTIKTKPADFHNDLARLIHITEKCLESLQNVELVCIEDFFVPRNPMQIGSAMSLVGLGTLMRVRMFEKGVPFIVISPQFVKKFSTGKGNGQKSMVIKEVYKRWDVDPKDDNQADSFVLAKIAQACITYAKGERNFPSFQLEVLKKVINTMPMYNCKF